MATFWVSIDMKGNAGTHHLIWLINILLLLLCPKTLFIAVPSDTAGVHG